MKAKATRDLSIGGATLAGHAFRAGLIDECHCFVAPASVGGSLRAFPEDVQLRLELIEARSFRSGMVHMYYGVRPWE